MGHNTVCNTIRLKTLAQLSCCSQLCT